MSPTVDDYGKRLVPKIIDETAQREPDRPFASILRSKTISDGYTDISYARLANAINRASWWLSESMGFVQTCEVFAYLGPNDLRYPILLAAAMKCGYQMMLPSPRNSNSYQLELLCQAGCDTVMFAETFATKILSMVGDSDVARILAPGLAELLDPTVVESFPYEVTYEEVKNDPFMILHTSGSTGPPKPITFTIQCTTTEDSHRLLKDPDSRLWWHLFANTKYFLGMPCFHAAGIWFALFIPVYWESIVVFGPNDRPLTASIVDAVHNATNINCGFYPPSILEEICNSPALQSVSKLKSITYGGGPLSTSAGDRLSKITILQNFIGFTENSAPPRFVSKPEDWNYFEFHPASGFVPRHLYDDIFELVFHRNMDSDATQTVFRLFPHLNSYAPGDVVSPHPTKPNLWRHRGRRDDLLVLSTGEKFDPIAIELILKDCPIVKDALMVGEGRAQAALLIEPDRSANQILSARETLDAVWPHIEKVNQASATQARILKNRVHVISPDQEFARSSKGTVQRKATLAKFHKELESLYSDSTPSNLPRVDTFHRPDDTQQITTNSAKSATLLPSHQRRDSLVSPRTIPSPMSYVQTNTQDTSREALPTMKNDDLLTIPESPTITAASTSTKGEELWTDSDSEFAAQDECLNLMRNALMAIGDLDSVDDDTDFFEAGLDSVQAVQLSNELQQISTGWPKNQAYAMELLYSNPTLRQLVQVMIQPVHTSSSSLHESPALDAEAKQALLSTEREDVHAPSPPLAPEKIDLTEELEAVSQGVVLHDKVEVRFDSTHSTAAGQSSKPDILETLIRKYTTSLPRSNPGRQITVALTGSTGSVGKHLLQHLVSDSGVRKIFCLNRSSGQEVQERMGLKMGSGSMDQDKPIEYFQVELSQPHLGLSHNQYAMLYNEADMILHNAWKVDFLQSITSFEKTHIAGVRHLVNFASSSPRRPRLVFISSIASMLQWQATEKIPEDIVLLSSISGANGYGQSKHVAERILYEASTAGVVDTTIIRLSQICGPTEAGFGVWKESDWLPQIIASCKSLAALPLSLGLADKIDWVPIDQLPGVIMDVVKHDLAKTKNFNVYHAANPRSTSWNSLLPAICKRLGPEVQLVSYHQWLCRLREAAELGIDTTRLPAVRLLSWLQQLNGPTGQVLPSLAIDKTVQVSSTLSSMTPVSGIDMERWMDGWGL